MMRCLQQLVRSSVDPTTAGWCRLVLVGPALVLASLDLGRAVSELASVEAFGALPWHPAAALPDYRLVVAILVILLVAALAYWIGYCTRVAGWVALAGLTLLLLCDQTLYQNERYLLWHVLLLFLLADAGAAFSIDALRGGRRSVPAWPLALLGLLPLIVYGYTALGKVNAPYFTGGTFATRFANQHALLTMPDAWRTPEFFGGLAIAVLLLEAGLAIGFAVPRLRRTAIVLGLGFHAGVMVVMPASTGYLMAFAVLGLTMVATYPFALCGFGSESQPSILTVKSRFRSEP